MNMEELTSLKEQIRLSNPIEEVIGERIQLDSHHKALCPFHPEKTPSFFVNVKNQYFYCFGCGAGGDVFNFVMRDHKICFFDAFKYLAQRAGITIPTTKEDFEEEQRRQDIYHALSEATNLYHENLPANVRDYLKDRGLTDETIDKYKIGFCSGGTQFTTDRETLIKIGLIYKNGEECFRGYITFPHLNHGRVIYMSGRGWPDKKHKKLEKDKVPLTYLLNEEALREKEVIVGEGEIDTLMLLQNGFNACGVLGANSFKEEWALKFKHCDTVYLTFDNDKAGENGNCKIAEWLGPKARIVSLPDGQDVNDFFKDKTKEDYQRLLDESLTLIEFRVKQIPAGTSPTRLPQILDPILKEMATLNIAQADAILKHTIKNHFGLTADSIKSYEKVLRDYRKEPKEEESRKISSKAELIEILHDDRGSKTIHPAQDYCDGVMTFAVKVRENICLVTSDSRLFHLEEASLEGFTLKQETVDTSRFSSQGVCVFLDGKYEISIPAIYQKIYDYIKRFIHFPNEMYLSFVTLWVMGTYVFMLFRYYPYVWLNAEKASGKTLLMEVLSSIAFNGELITNPTESVIFRDISNNLITMFIDEVEQLRKRDKDIYGSLICLLNSGFNKAGVVKRTESTGQGGFVVKSYSAYSPKMFAGISEIDDVLQDRTVRIPLLRKKDEEAVKRYKGTAEVIELQRSIRDDLYVFALTFAKDIAELYYQEGPDGIEGMGHLNNRELDIWEPIFLLANIIDAQRQNTELTDAMESLSRKSLEEKQSDSVSQNETYKILTVLKVMLDEIKPISDDGNIRVFEAERVLEYFKANEDFDWIQKTNVLTRRLKKVKVASDQRRIDGEKKRVYSVNVKEFVDLCERFKI